MQGPDDQGTLGMFKEEQGHLCDEGSQWEGDRR